MYCIPAWIPRCTRGLLRAHSRYLWKDDCVWCAEIDRFFSVSECLAQSIDGPLSSFHCVLKSLVLLRKVTGPVQQSLTARPFSCEMIAGANGSPLNHLTLASELLACAVWAQLNELTLLSDKKDDVSSYYYIASRALPGQPMLTKPSSLPCLPPTSQLQLLLPMHILHTHALPSQSGHASAAHGGSQKPPQY